MLKNMIITVIILILLTSIIYGDSSSITFFVMKDTRFSTPVYISDSGKKGPTVAIIGGVHGNETAGILAAEEIIKAMPKTGRLVVIPRANKAACDSSVRTEYYMDDLNRCFPGSKGDNPAKAIAFEVTEIIRKYKPSAVIDLHESEERYGETIGALGQSLVISEKGDSAGIVLDTLEEINKRVGKENELTYTSGAPGGSLNKELSELLDIPVITVETWSKKDIGTRVKQQTEVVKALLDYFNMH